MQGGGQAQQVALEAALLKNVYDGDAAAKPWAELMARYLLRWVDMGVAKPLCLNPANHQDMLLQRLAQVESV